MRFILGVVALAVIAGCADSPTPTAGVQVAAAPAATASAPQQVCHREMPTGSNLPRTVCEPAVSDADRRIELDKIQSQIRQQTPQRAPGAGG